MENVKIIADLLAQTAELNAVTAQWIIAAAAAREALSAPTILAAVAV